MFFRRKKKPTLIIIDSVGQRVMLPGGKVGVIHDITYTLKADDRWEFVIKVIGENEYGFSSF